MNSIDQELVLAEREVVEQPGHGVDAGQPLERRRARAAAG